MRVGPVPSAAGPVSEVRCGFGRMGSVWEGVRDRESAREEDVKGGGGGGRVCVLGVRGGCQCHWWASHNTRGGKIRVGRDKLTFCHPPRAVTTTYNKYRSTPLPLIRGRRLKAVLWGIQNNNRQYSVTDFTIRHCTPPIATQERTPKPCTYPLCWWNSSSCLRNPSYSRSYASASLFISLVIFSRDRTLKHSLNDTESTFLGQGGTHERSTKHCRRQSQNTHRRSVLFGAAHHHAFQ